MLYAARKVCPNDPHGRINCGYPGITAKECERKGCCFRAHPAGVPWCFYHRVVEEGKVPHETSSPVSPQMHHSSWQVHAAPGLGVLCQPGATGGHVRGSEQDGVSPFPVGGQSFLTQGMSGEEAAKP